MDDNAEKPKPTIFYTKNKAPQTSLRRDGGKRDNVKNQRENNPFSGTKQKRDSNDRIETFKPKTVKKADHLKSARQKFNNANDDFDSPWKQKNKYKSADDKNVPIVDDDRHHQHKDEIYVYSENSCKAVFKHRQQAIIKAFITEETAPQFKHLIEWLVSQHLGYDIVSHDHITKITGTPHHGGICLIVKKREPLSVLSYIEKNQDKAKDYVLAIDDVNNPHNLGGLVRTAAFYGINGIMIRQINLLESGAAMRVAEGGNESVVPIKSEDFIASLDQLKQQGYQVIVLLPCQIAAAKAKALHQIKINKKAVFVLFQRINVKLIDNADEVIYLKGNDNMASLNISVAAGILLSQI